MKVLTTVFIALLLFSCKSKSIQKSIQKFKIPFLIEKRTFKSIEYIIDSSINISDYSILYLGKRTDTICVNYQYESEKDISITRLRNFSSKNNQLKIIIDTNQIISKLSFENLSFVKAYPIFLANNSSDTIAIAYGKKVHLILEAVNKKGKWQAIEVNFHFSCGTGLFETYLLPNQVAVSSRFISKGNFKTKLRLRMDSIVSNEIFGEINLSQFSKR